MAGQRNHADALAVDFDDLAGPLVKARRLVGPVLVMRFELVHSRGAARCRVLAAVDARRRLNASQAGTASGPLPEADWGARYACLSDRHDDQDPAARTVRLISFVGSSAWA